MSDGEREVMWVTDWVSCPYCGGDCDVTQPSMYNSRFDCRECGENITIGWVYFDKKE